MTIKHFVSNLFFVRMCDKMAISAYILKIVEKDPFLRLQMRAKEMFNRKNVKEFTQDIYSVVISRKVLAAFIN